MLTLQTTKKFIIFFNNKYDIQYDYNINNVIAT